MDITTICKVIIVIGSLQTCSRYQGCQYAVGAVDGNLFQAPEMVEWAKAEQACQKNNAKLFRPSETLFDMSLFSECNFNDDLWVAATYITITNVGSDSSVDSFIRCKMCKIEANCVTTCLYRACGNQCVALCKVRLELINYLYDVPYNWTEAQHWCLTQNSDIGDEIQNASSLFSSGYCAARCFWTKHVIQVQLKHEIAQGNESVECGILHNGTISFTSCNIHLHPLCEKVNKTALETPRPFFSEGKNSCELMNNTITYMTTTEASGRTKGINATVITSSLYGTSTVANEIAKHTTKGLNEELSSLLVPVGVTTSRNDLEDTPQKSDTGIIIGSVIGSFVFLMFTFLVIICARRKVLQRTAKMKSKHDIQNMKMHTTGTTHEPIAPYQGQDVPLESESGSFSQKQKSNPVKSAYMIDQELSNFNYATVKKNENVNSNNLIININYVSYDDLNDIRERRDDNAAAKIYDNRF